jgi:hypothetical protein
MKFSILDFMELTEVPERPSNPPYKWSFEDSIELKEGTYLRTKESFERVCKRIAEELSLNTKNRLRINVDRRIFLSNILVNNARLTTTRTGAIVKRDHSTIIHSIKSYKILKDDKLFKENVRILSEFFSKFDLSLQTMNRCKCGTPVPVDSFCSKKCKDANENKSFKNYSITLSVELNAPDDLEAVRKSIDLIELLKDAEGKSSILVDVFERSLTEERARSVDIAEQLNKILTK